MSSLENTRTPNRPLRIGTIIRKHRFANFVQLRETFPHADQVGKFTVFNVGGNKVRLIAAVHYIIGTGSTYATH